MSEIGVSPQIDLSLDHHSTPRLYIFKSYFSTQNMFYFLLYIAKKNFVLYVLLLNIVRESMQAQLLTCKYLCSLFCFVFFCQGVVSIKEKNGKPKLTCDHNLLKKTNVIVGSEILSCGINIDFSSFFLTISWSQKTKYIVLTSPQCFCNSSMCRKFYCLKALTVLSSFRCILMFSGVCTMYMHSKYSHYFTYYSQLI